MGTMKDSGIRYKVGRHKGRSKYRPLIVNRVCRIENITSAFGNGLLCKRQIYLRIGRAAAGRPSRGAKIFSSRPALTWSIPWK